MRQFESNERGRRGTICKFESKERGRRGTMCKFESKEVCESLCFHNKSECTGWRKLVVSDAVCGACAARGRRRAATNSGYRFFFEIFVCVVILGKARYDCISQYNADADVV